MTTRGKKHAGERGLPSLAQARQERRRALVAGRVRFRGMTPRFWLWTATGFAVFGVGAYSFAPWKVAISGLYKRLRFRVLGPVAGKPQVLDDTGYALPCASEAEARYLLELLESRPAREFFGARVFWDAKRPITAGLLNQLDLAKLGVELGLSPQSPGLSKLPNIAK